MNRSSLSSCLFIPLLLLGCDSKDEAPTAVAPACGQCGEPSGIGFTAEDEPYLKAIEEMGFQRKNVRPGREGYVVEGDIYMSKEGLASPSTLPKTSQRMVFYTVNQARAYSVRVQIHSSISGWTQHIQRALDNWNVSNSKLKFILVNSAPDITIADDTWTGLPTHMQNLGDACGYGSWPTNTGAPGRFISINMDQPIFADDARRVRTITHEFGHNIGLAHTNESGTLIQGTPATDDNSIMNGGQCYTGALTHSAWDRIASYILYPQNEDPYLKADFNGDGRKDLVYITTDGTIRLRLGSGLSSESLLTGPNGYGNLSQGRYLTGDFNGDGRSDLFFIGNGGDVYVRNSTGTQLGPQINLVSANGDNWTTGRFYVDDHSGDGKADLYFISTPGDVFIRSSTGTALGGSVWKVNYGTQGTGKYYTADLNGDRKSDLFFILNNGSVDVRLSNGSGFGQKPGVGGATGTLLDGGFMFGDWDGDGKTDLIHVSNYGHVKLRVSNGSGLGKETMLLDAKAYGTKTGGLYMLGDLSGDGRADLMFIGNDGDVHTRNSTGNTTIGPQVDLPVIGNLASGAYL